MRLKGEPAGGRGGGTSDGAGGTSIGLGTPLRFRPAGDTCMARARRVTTAWIPRAQYQVQAAAAAAAAAAAGCSRGVAALQARECQSGECQELLFCVEGVRLVVGARPPSLRPLSVQAGSAKAVKRPSRVSNVGPRVRRSHAQYRVPNW